MKKSDLQNVLEFCEKEKLYLGEGTPTPTAKILFIGKESGWNEKRWGEATPEKIPIVSDENASHNLDCWRNHNGNLEQLKCDARKEWPNSPTWRSYETLTKIITGQDIAKYDFLDYSFITELSQICMPKSNHLKDNNLTKESVEKRKKLFKESFFQKFPVIIMACGHYPRDFDFDMEDIFDVKWDGETKVLSEGNYYNVHHGKDKILIHTRQVSMGVTNLLLSEIANLCKPIYEKENL